MHRNDVIKAGAAALGTTLALAAAQVATATAAAPRAVASPAVAPPAAASPAAAPTAAAPPAAADAAGVAAAGPRVTVTIKSKTRTLLATETVQTKSGWVTRGGAGTGKCPATSAQGALNVATHGRWVGKWYASYHEYYITAILGDSETSKKYYWGLYVNGKSTSKGACEVKLKSGDRVLFKVTG